MGLKHPLEWYLGPLCDPSRRNIDFGCVEQLYVGPNSELALTDLRIWGKLS